MTVVTLGGLILASCSKRAAELSNPGESRTGGPPAVAERLAPDKDGRKIPGNPAFLQDTLAQIRSAPDPDDRASALYGVVELVSSGRVPPREATRALGELLLTEPDTGVKLDILDRITDIGDRDAILAMANGLAREQPKEVRSTTVDALETYGDRRAVEILENVAGNDPEPAIREEAARAAQSLRGSGKSE